MLAAALLLAACGEPARTAAQPVEMTAGTACSLDGMLLMDFPGPKGQIQYEQGAPEYFCDTMELFSIYLRPEQSRRVLAIYTQDMGKADWKEPRGHWIDARQAWYVAGSDMRGSMGPTLAAFANEADARAFAGKHGGKVLAFDMVTLDVITLDRGHVHDEKM